MQLVQEIDIPVKEIELGLDSEKEVSPYIVFDHRTYMGIEAHIFTASHAALWIPELNQNGDVEVRLFDSVPTHMNSEDRKDAWNRLMISISTLFGNLKSYRSCLMNGYIPPIIWAHHNFQWYHQTREAPFHGPQRTNEFLDAVDESIRYYIAKINECGFATIESCSGLLDEHPDRDPYWPYVMLDDRAYPGVTAHLFTLADMALWIPSYAPHRFDVYIKKRKSDSHLIAWKRLVDSAKLLSTLLCEYSRSSTQHE